MEIRLIFSALMRSKVSIVLLGLQVAITLAIMCNAMFIIVERARQINRPSGMNESETFVFGSTGFTEGFDSHLQLRADLLMLRGMPGVVDATNINTSPLSAHGWTNGIGLNAKQKTATATSTLYFVDTHGINTLDTHLVAGRNFRDEEVENLDQGAPLHPPAAIITRALAEAVFPDTSAIGKEIYLNPAPPTTTIIGVIDRLQGPWVNAGNIENAALIPGYMPYGKSSRLVVRAERGRRDEIMKNVEQRMTETNAGRIVNQVRSLESLRYEAYAKDRAMIIILSVVILCLVLTTALGIVGMASFWVAQRTKQIGTRRALGATRGAIVLHFLTENFLITTAGLAVGGALAYGLSLWLLATADGAAILPWYYVPIGSISLWALGQAAALGPALRAARIPPAVATRGL